MDSEVAPLDFHLSPMRPQLSKDAASEIIVAHHENIEVHLKIIDAHLKSQFEP